MAKNGHMLKRGAAAVFFDSIAYVTAAESAVNSLYLKNKALRYITATVAAPKQHVEI